MNPKVAPISVKEVNKMRLSLQVGPTSCYYKSHGVNWPLTDFYLVQLSLLKSPALVNDYWTVINTTVTEGSKHFLLRRGEGETSTHNKWGCAILTRKLVPKNLKTQYLTLTPKNLGTYLKLTPTNLGTQTLRFHSK